MTRRMLAVAALVLLPLLGQAQTGPQPVLPKEKLVIVTSDGVSHPFQVEIAISNK